MMIIQKVAWVCLKDNKVLMARSKGKDLFYIPGGKLEPNETNNDALIREIKEELTVNLTPDTIEFYQDFEAPAHGKPPGTIVRISRYFADYEGTLNPDSEIEEIGWLTSSDKERTSEIDHKILDALKLDEKIS